MIDCVNFGQWGGLSNTEITETRNFTNRSFPNCTQIVENHANDYNSVQHIRKLCFCFKSAQSLVFSREHIKSILVHTCECRSRTKLIVSKKWWIAAQISLGTWPMLQFVSQFIFQATQLTHYICYSQVHSWSCGWLCCWGKTSLETELYRLSQKLIA